MATVEAQQAESTQSNRIPGLLKMAGIAGGSLLAMTVFGIALKQVGTLLDNQPQPIGEPVPLPEFAQSIASPASSPPLPSSPSPQSSQQALWDAIGSENQRLTQAISTTESKLTQARAQRWWMHAINKCNEAGLSQCPSPYTWLLRAYQAQAATVQQIVLEGKIAVDAEVAGRYRHEIQQLQDISNALSLPVGGTAPEPFVQTVDLSGVIEQFYTKASQYEAFRQTQPESGAWGAATL